MHFNASIDFELLSSRSDKLIASLATAVAEPL